MATHHHFSILNHHRSVSDEESVFPINRDGSPQAVSRRNQWGRRAEVRLATITRPSTDPYSSCVSLNKRVSHAPQEYGGANGRTRTVDLLFTKQLLCRLSYVGSPFQFTMIGAAFPELGNAGTGTNSMLEGKGFWIPASAGMTMHLRPFMGKGLADGYAEAAHGAGGGQLADCGDDGGCPAV